MESDDVTVKYGLVSAEYSAGLQSDVLGIVPELLQEPILDLGCGVQANLVKMLRAEGKAAYGVDVAADEGAFVTKSDWFDYSLVSCAWGTVISHQGFSNRFLHNHFSRDGDAGRYARRYMEILWSLKKDGVFIYTPGLPFIEDILPPERFSVTRRSIDLVKRDMRFEAALEKALGSNPICACRVKRL